MGAVDGGGAAVVLQSAKKYHAADLDLEDAMRGFTTIATLSACLLWATMASGYTITVDGDASDWLLEAPLNVNNGHIARDAALRGEYIWTDAEGDERTDFGAPDSRVDITELRVTADAANIYFMIRMANIDAEYGDGAP
jgi:hypothetical protein